MRVRIREWSHAQYRWQVVFGDPDDPTFNPHASPFKAQANRMSNWLLDNVGPLYMKWDYVITRNVVIFGFRHQCDAFHFFFRWG